MALPLREIIRRIPIPILPPAGPLALIGHLAPLNMRLEPLAKIRHDHTRGPDRRDEQQNRKHGERGQHAAALEILLLPRRLRPHAEELEDEVGHGGAVEGDDGGVAEAGFAAHEEGGEDQKADDDGDGGDGEDLLGEGAAADDDDELDGEAEEEEEVEFEEGDVDLELCPLVNARVFLELFRGGSGWRT